MGEGVILPAWHIYPVIPCQVGEDEPEEKASADPLMLLPAQ
jgi:hypothetical protein